MGICVNAVRFSVALRGPRGTKLVTHTGKLVILYPVTEPGLLALKSIRAPGNAPRRLVSTIFQVAVSTTPVAPLPDVCAVCTHGGLDQ